MTSFMSHAGHTHTLTTRKVQGSRHQLRYLDYDTLRFAVIEQQSSALPERARAGLRELDMGADAPRRLALFNPRTNEVWGYAEEMCIDGHPAARTPEQERRYRHSLRGGCRDVPWMTARA